MAVAQVQAAGNTSASPNGLAFGASTPANNLIVVIPVFDGTWTSIADDIGNVYTQIGSELVGASFRSRAYRAKNSTAGVRTVTVTTSGGTFVDLFLEECSGQDLTTPLDNSAGTVHDGVSADFTDSVTLNVANDLLIAFCEFTIGTSSITTAGYTSDNTANLSILAHKTTNPGSGSSSVTFHNDTFPSPRDGITWLIGIEEPQSVPPRNILLKRFP